jgi:hypothetical protein
MDRNGGPACSGTVARHGPEYAVDLAILLQMLRNAVSGSQTKAKSKKKEKEKKPREHRHHTIPVYLCGGIDQRPNMPLLEAPLHSQLHSELVGFSIALEEAAQEGLAQLPPAVKATWSKNDRPVIFQVAAYNEGRRVIAAALADFYNAGQWMKKGRDPTIEVGLDRETPRYVDGENTSLRLGCRKPDK